jgi:hypothetical protein
MVSLPQFNVCPLFSPPLVVALALFKSCLEIYLCQVSFMPTPVYLQHLIRALASNIFAFVVLIPLHIFDSIIRSALCSLHDYSIRRCQLDGRAVQIPIKSNKVIRAQLSLPQTLDEILLPVLNLLCMIDARKMAMSPAYALIMPSSERHGPLHPIRRAKML